MAIINKSVIIVDSSGNPVQFPDVFKQLSDIKVGDIAGGNYTEIETDGTLKFVGNATTWTDFIISATRVRQGALSKPDFDYTNLGLLFPQNDATEIIYFIAQMKHEKKLDSQIYWHVHYIQSEANKPTFKLDYKYYKNGQAVPGSWTTISTADGNKGIFTYPGSGSILQIATFPAITPPANETVSANIDIKFYRDDNDVTGDVLVKYTDFHYEINTSGSRQQFSK